MLYSALRLGSLNTELSLPNLRRTAIGFAAAAAIFAGGGAHAQEAKLTPVASPTERVTVDTDCQNYKPGVLMADTKCEVLKGQALDAQGRALDSQLAREKAIGTCLQRIKTYFDQGKISRETVMQYGKDRACELANKLG